MDERKAAQANNAKEVKTIKPNICFTSIFQLFIGNFSNITKINKTIESIIVN